MCRDGSGGYGWFEQRKSRGSQIISGDVCVCSFDGLLQRLGEVFHKWLQQHASRINRQVVNVQRSERNTVPVDARLQVEGVLTLRAEISDASEIRFCDVS